MVTLEVLGQLEGDGQARAPGHHPVGEAELHRVGRLQAIAQDDELLGPQQAGEQRPRDRATIGRHQTDGHVRVGKLRALGHEHHI